MKEEDRAGINKSDYQPAAAAPSGRKREQDWVGHEPLCPISGARGAWALRKGVGCMFHSRPARRRRLKPVICMQERDLSTLVDLGKCFGGGGEGVEENIVKNKN